MVFLLHGFLFLWLLRVPAGCAITTAITQELVTLSCFNKHIKSVHRRQITQYSVHVWVILGLFSSLLELAFVLIDQGFEEYQS